MEDYSFDLTRIFFGEMPALFYAEIVLRVVVLYLYALAIIRMFGKRSAGELTVLDVLLIIALGTAVGDPMLYPDVPLLHGMLIITLIVGIQRLGLYWANRHPKMDRLLKGRPSLVVSNGVLNLDGLEHIGMSKREVFQMARQSGYRNLGEIRRMYIETDDKASIYGYEPDQVRPGLQFEPPWEIDQHATFEAGAVVKQQTIAACTNCGQTAEFREGKKVPPCPRCQETIWSAVDET
jgi:uncharacterized membrane protein YcaP (DUF421 family)